MSAQQTATLLYEIIQDVRARAIRNWSVPDRRRRRAGFRSKTTVCKLLEAAASTGRASHTSLDDVYSGQSRAQAMARAVHLLFVTRAASAGDARSGLRRRDDPAAADGGA
ncbi:MAG: hypothetical protein R3C16_07775 [Hyphomonadaceae bacterium]